MLRPVLGCGGIAGLFEVATRHDLESWKHDPKAGFLAGLAGVLPLIIDRAGFAFHGTSLRGREEQRERCKRGVPDQHAQLLPHLCTLVSRNFDAWFAAFGVTEDHALYRPPLSLPPRWP